MKAVPDVDAYVKHEVAMHAPPMSDDVGRRVAPIFGLVWVPRPFAERQRLAQIGYAEHRAGDCPVCAAGNCTKCARGDVLGLVVAVG